MKRALRSGMTLIEVMVSLAVLTIGVSGAFSTVIYASRSLGTSNHVSEASMLAQSLLTALLAVPFSSTGSGASAAPKTLFTNITTVNDNDIADSTSVFTQPTLPANSYDHADSELASSPISAMVAPLPTGRTTYERYWNIAPVVTGSTNGVSIAVIVRWREGSAWRRTVLIGTRYSP